MGISGGIPLLNFSQLAVADVEDPVGDLEHLVIVRRGDDGHSLLFVQTSEELNNLLPP